MNQECPDNIPASFPLTTVRVSPSTRKQKVTRKTFNTCCLYILVSGTMHSELQK